MLIRDLRITERNSLKLLEGHQCEVDPLAPLFANAHFIDLVLHRVFVMKSPPITKFYTAFTHWWIKQKKKPKEAAWRLVELHTNGYEAKKKITFDLRNNALFLLSLLAFGSVWLQQIGFVYNTRARLLTRNALYLTIFIKTVLFF